MTNQEFMAMSQNKDLCLLREFDNKVYTLYGMSGEHTIEAVIIEDNIEYSALLAYGDCQIDDDEKFKIIARPLSDLTKPIEHKGEKFVPIVELAKMCFNNTYTNLPNIKSYEVLNSECGESFGFIGFTDDERFSLTFDNTFNNQSFEFWIDGSRHLIKQFDLFLKLIEWKFNLMNESEPFIDINTLEKNPYK